MIKITLTAEDAQALGVPEVLEYDDNRPRMKQLRRLQEECGLNYTDLLEKLHTADLVAVGMLVWLAVTKHGADVTWNDFDLDSAGTKVEVLEEDPKEVTAS